MLSLLCAVWTSFLSYSCAVGVREGMAQIAITKALGLLGLSTYQLCPCGLRHTYPTPPHPCSVRRNAEQQRNPTLYTMGPRLINSNPPQHILDKVDISTPHYTTLHHTTPHYTTLHHTTLHHTTPHYTTPHYHVSIVPFQIQENKINIEIHTTSTLQVKHYCIDSECIV